MWLRCLLSNVWRRGNIWGLIHTKMRVCSAFWKWALRPSGGRGSRRWCLRSGDPENFCYFLRVTRSCNVVLLVKLKDVPGVLDRDRVLGKMGSIAEWGRKLCWALWREAGDTIRKLCVGQATKTVLVDCFAEPSGGTLGRKNCKLMKT